jgi:ubiquitin-conjugating enzyme E2 Z
VLTVHSTWRGERGEEWSAAQGLESILISIQSLMSGNPYENEPGFEDANEASDKKNQKDYVDKVCCSIVANMACFLILR